MDAYQRALALRAQGILGNLLSDSTPTTIERAAAAFVEAARITAATGPRGEVRRALAESRNDLVRKAVAENTGMSIWSGDDARALAQAFIASIAPGSLVDQIARYAQPIPTTQRRVLIATGFSADEVQEGAPKVVVNADLSVDEELARKVAAILVCTRELVMATDDASTALFRRELENAVLRGTNQSVLDSIVSSGTTSIAGTGDALDDLRAGLRAAAPSTGYVVAAGSEFVTDIATRTEASGGLGVRGGDFRPGISIVPHDGLSGLVVIPASRLALYSTALDVRSSTEGNVSMAASPTSPSNTVSLFQTGSIGLIAERRFHIAGDSSGVVVVEAGS